MISRGNNFIYLHVPKTGGNTIQTILLPLSEDSKQTTGSQDGTDRFDVVGPMTVEKHASLSDYAKVMGDTIPQFRLLISVRHPFRRAVSGYFSPHKWIKPDGRDGWVSEVPFWDETRFFDLLKVRNHMPATDYLRINGRIQTPDLIIRHENFSRDLEKCLKTLKLPFTSTQNIPHVNSTVAPSELLRFVLSSHNIRDQVETIYKSDMDYFGYESYKI